MPVEEDEDETGSVDTPPPAKKVRKAKEQPLRVWKKEDICHPPPPEYDHPVPELLQMLTIEMLEDVVYQTNLYER